MVNFSGPVASIFNERYSTRVTMFIGGILSALGLLISAFATEFFVILLTFGIITGNSKTLLSRLVVPRRRLLSYMFLKLIARGIYIFKID